MAKTEFDKGYINGFYGALQGVLFATELPGANVKNIKQDVEDTIQEMRDSGDLEHLTGTADAIIDIVKNAMDKGNTKEVFDFLDSIFAEKKG